MAAPATLFSLDGSGSGIGCPGACSSPSQQPKGPRQGPAAVELPGGLGACADGAANAAGDPSPTPKHFATARRRDLQRRLVCQFAGLVYELPVAYS